VARAWPLVLLGRLVLVSGPSRDLVPEGEAEDERCRSWAWLVAAQGLVGLLGRDADCGLGCGDCWVGPLGSLPRAGSTCEVQRWHSHNKHC
jgi:hypothetical protein